MARRVTAFVRPPSTQEAVLAELRRRIGAGELRPGEPIRAEQVGAELGVSRVPVREALRILEGEGQVVYEPHRGSFVADLSLDDLRELYRMRELLEEEAVRAALPLDDATLERLSDHVADADGASARGDLAAYAEANRSFHLELYAASGRPLLARTIRQLWDASDAYRALYANRGAHRATAAEHHRAILAALAAGDADATVVAQNRHREHALAALAQILAEPAAP
ncbi:MAG TPA: GntR family transcriptional regulator [Thermoleophilaceae bacterium]|nr:GntR family transcriptional regulator [Thermoleophilaceae bacterium]